MNLANARYEREDGYAILRVEVDGKVATIGTEWKPSLRAAGIVFLGSDFQGVMPPIDFEPSDGGLTTLRGCTRDVRMVRLYDQFWSDANSGSFTPGPVSIPR